MTFTPDELRRLHVADAVEDARPSRRGVGGRPRLPIINANDRTERRRLRQWCRYHGLPIEKKRGGRPRTQPDTPEQQARRERASRRYYAKRGKVACA